MEKYLDKYILIQNKYNFISLGGSLALIIGGFLPERYVKDMDIISTQYISKKEIINEIETTNNNIYNIDKNLFTIDGINFDLFINPNATYKFVNYKGYKLRISPLEEVLFFKLKKRNFKDIEDIKNIIDIMYNKFNKNKGQVINNELTIHNYG